MTAGAQGADEDDVALALDAVMRRDGGRLLSGLVSVLRNFQLAEDSLQDAVEAALLHWRRVGLPHSPTGWLMRAARRKALDRLRRAQNFNRKSPDIGRLYDMLAESRREEEEERDFIRDERLALIFTCCHPALDRKTSVALTLRSICGLKTEEVADAFLDTIEAMAQRLVRARHKIAKAGIAYQVPGPEDWRERLENVLAVVYLMFNEGYASSGEHLLRADLCGEAIRIARLLNDLALGEGEVEGLLALMLLHHARRDSRQNADGSLATLEQQDRRLWRSDEIDEGRRAIEQALKRGMPGPYQIQAAIAALHAEAPSFAETDWPQILALYDILAARFSNPIFELNRIVALSFAKSPQEALAALEPLGRLLGAYQPFHAAHADLLMRTGKRSEAALAFSIARNLSQNAAERGFLERRLQECHQGV
ncbi:hypothetical protein H2O14_13190 [Rhizobium sp. G21]|nr:hypothetical protein [Rhizobium sp. G21]